MFSTVVSLVYGFLCGCCLLYFLSPPTFVLHSSTSHFLDPHRIDDSGCNLHIDVVFIVLRFALLPFYPIFIEDRTHSRPDRMRTSTHRFPFPSPSGHFSYDRT
ncbi:hypothetical protein BDV98DRAFT_570443 [Pterulicium gracile]|uniref:Uncharacterized protein n=1 Tax=Pterulicium gracile TaxID=1884261 RepID=A0A5C3QD09_9AGAR|nr:hypothetical protein BDV98DRAFT_570443 [Pterula gracilis]